MEEINITVNQIYFDGTMSDTLSLTSSQIATLEGIATQNPMEGGEAVYRARAMLRVYLGDAFSSSRKRKPDSQTFSQKEKLINVYPNPAKDYCTIEFNKSVSDRKFRITISDGLGRTVLEKVMIIDTNIFISTSQLMQGIYNLNVSGSEISDHKKLIIIR